MSEPANPRSNFLPERIPPRAAYAVLAVTVFLWAVSLVVAQAAHGEIPPIGLSFWRWSVGATVLLPFVWRELRQKWHSIAPRLGLFFAMGGLMGGSGTLLLWSVKYTSTMNATLVNSSQPAFTALAALLFLRHRVTAWQFAGVAAALLGVSIMAVRADLQNLVDLNFNPGDILVLISTVGYTAYALNIQRLPGDLSMALAVFLIVSCGSLLILPFYIAESIFVKPVPVTPTSVGALAVLALLTSVLTTFAWNICNRSVGPHRAAVFVNLFPFYTAGLAVTFLGERLSGYHYWGVGLVCAGITLVALMEKKRGA